MSVRKKIVEIKNKDKLSIKQRHNEKNKKKMIKYNANS